MKRTPPPRPVLDYRNGKQFPQPLRVQSVWVERVQIGLILLVCAPVALVVVAAFVWMVLQWTVFLPRG
ncbi:MAG TPA: hypothetical protein VK986_20815 [Tepidisphaeraceae bacterium]|nr:hypothetical protein [Tepidisphaeraceae bacterium]